MKNKPLFLLFGSLPWVMMLVSCTAKPVPTADFLPLKSVTEAATNTDTNTPSPELSTTSTATIPSTQTPTSIPTLKPAPEPQIISPLITPICKDPAASPAEMGIQDQVFLVLTFDDMGSAITNQGEIVAHPSSLQPEPIPGTTPKNGFISLSKVTPDGKWVNVTYLSSELHRAEEKLVSWDGSQVQEVYTEDYDPLAYRFLYQENMLVILDISNLGFLPLALRDLTSGGERRLPGMPTEAYWAKVFFTTPGDVYNLLIWQGGRHENRLYLYNDSDHATVPVYPWVNEPGGWLTATPYQDSQGKFGLYARRFYGLDLAFDLDLETILSNKPYDDVMKKIRLPFGEVAGYPEMEIARLENGLLLASPIADGVNQYAVYRLNFSNLSLDDFCISNAADSAQIAVSADGRFAAVNFFLLDPPGIHLKGVVLLNLETGQHFWIPGAPFAVTGWLDK